MNKRHREPYNHTEWWHEGLMGLIETSHAWEERARESIAAAAAGIDGQIAQGGLRYQSGATWV